ncbi:(2Fe-2S)-binding protein [candidate division KSB1 bacterium]|nr:(2Fe-2S)-binding protein [candidate division KSB1 bacterium]
MKETISFNLNGKPVSLAAEGDKGLLWVLRTDFDLTGTKFGCGINYCGACTVVVDGEPVRSCQYPVKNVRGKNVTTIEGLSNNGKLHPLQEAFIEHNAMQCGFCTSGMIMQGYSFLEKNPNKSFRFTSVFN